MAEAKEKIEKLPCPVCNTIINLPAYINSSDYKGHIVCQVENCNAVLNVTMKNNQVIKLLIDKEVRALVIEKRDFIQGYDLLNRLREILEKQ